MYQATQQWRASVSLPSLVDPSSPGYFDFHEVEAVARAGWSMYFHGIDKLGRPIFVQGLAGLDTTKLLQATTQERITLNFACTLETACQSRYRAATLARRAKGDTEALIDGEGPWLPLPRALLTLAPDNFMIVDIGGLGMGTFWAVSQSALTGAASLTLSLSRSSRRSCKACCESGLSSHSSKTTLLTALSPQCLS
jgi:hypothetical protein